MSELAHRLLGAVGDIVVDVERPKWGGYPAGAPRFPPSNWPPDGPPPFSELLFYGKPEFVGTFPGLCGADWVTVRFDENLDGQEDYGRRVSGINAERRFGVEGALDGPYTSDAEVAERCQRAGTPRGYFPAPDAEAADDIARFLARISRDAAANGPLRFSVSCFPDAFGVCRDQRTFLRSMDVRNIEASAKVDCPNQPPRFSTCYGLTILEPNRHIGRSVFLSWNVVVVGSTRANKVTVSSVRLRPEIAIS
ncbi:MAG: hypothetical protein ABI306_11375 [Caulobacteraceae bacterium]